MEILGNNGKSVGILRNPCKSLEILPSLDKSSQILIRPYKFLQILANLCTSLQIRTNPCKPEDTTGNHEKAVGNLEIIKESKSGRKTKGKPLEIGEITRLTQYTHLHRYHFRFFRHSVCPPLQSFELEIREDLAQHYDFCHRLWKYWQRKLRKHCVRLILYVRKFDMHRRKLFSNIAY